MKAERGNIMVLFALTLIVIIGFIGLSVDVGMLSLKRNSLENMLQVVRNDRFTYQDLIRYSDHPGEEVYHVIHDTLVSNGFDGTVKVYFYEQTPVSNQRYYQIRTVLSDDFTYYFARVFGMTTTTVSVSLDGGEAVGDGSSDVVWYPEELPSIYNGSYTSQPGGGFVHVSSDIPPEWIP